MREDRHATGPDPAPQPEQATVPGQVADAVAGHWADRLLPVALRPYARLMRLERPIGWWLLLIPCWWSAALAAIKAGAPWPDPWHLALFLIGAVVMRGAGCVYNDILDRNIDAQVARTRLRPIPSGQVSARAAAAFMVLLSLIGLLVLLQFNRFTIFLGLASLAVVAVYPLMKRITHWPQFVLGLAFSWGALLGWSARFGEVELPAALLYAAAVLWTIGYDTIYAHQDKEDDAIVGVRSTALLFRDRTHLAVSLFFAGTVVLIGVALVLADAGPAAFAGLLLAALHMVWQVATLDSDDGDNCLARFRANRTTGLVLFAGMAVDALIANAW